MASRSLRTKLEIPVAKAFAGVINKIKYIFDPVPSLRLKVCDTLKDRLSIDQTHSSLQLSEFNCSVEGKKVTFPLKYPCQSSTLENLI